MVELTCKTCGAAFQGRPNRRYCLPACKQRARVLARFRKRHAPSAAEEPWAEPWGWPSWPEAWGCDLAADWGDEATGDWSDLPTADWSDLPTWEEAFGDLPTWEEILATNEPVKGKGAKL